MRRLVGADAQFCSTIPGPGHAEQEQQATTVWRGVPATCQLSSGPVVRAHALKSAVQLTLTGAQRRIGAAVALVVVFLLRHGHFAVGATTGIPQGRGIRVGRMPRLRERDDGRSFRNPPAARGRTCRVRPGVSA